MDLRLVIVAPRRQFLSGQAVPWRVVGSTERERAVRCGLPWFHPAPGCTAPDAAKEDRGIARCPQRCLHTLVEDELYGRVRPPANRGYEHHVIRPSPSQGPPPFQPAGCRPLRHRLAASPPAPSRSAPMAPGSAPSETPTAATFAYSLRQSLPDGCNLHPLVAQGRDQPPVWLHLQFVMRGTGALQRRFHHALHLAQQQQCTLQQISCPVHVHYRFTVRPLTCSARWRCASRVRLSIARVAAAAYHIQAPSYACRADCRKRSVPAARGHPGTVALMGESQCPLAKTRETVSSEACRIVVWRGGERRRRAEKGCSTLNVLARGVELGRSVS